MPRSPKVIQQVTAHGQHLFAANDPLSESDRQLAAMFDGPLEGERPEDRRALELQIAAQTRAEWKARS